MDRERAETHLRLLAEAELRRVMKMPSDGIPGRWYSPRLALVAGALTAVGAVGADVADQIQASESTTNPTVTPRLAIAITRHG